MERTEFLIKRRGGNFFFLCCNVGDEAVGLYLI